MNDTKNITSIIELLFIILTCIYIVVRFYTFNRKIEKIEKERSDKIIKILVENQIEYKKYIAEVIEQHTILTVKITKYLESLNINKIED